MISWIHSLELNISMKFSSSFRRLLNARCRFQTPQRIPREKSSLWTNAFLLDVTSFWRRTICDKVDRIRRKKGVEGYWKKSLYTKNSSYKDWNKKNKWQFEEQNWIARIETLHGQNGWPKRWIYKTFIEYLCQRFFSYNCRLLYRKLSPKMNCDVRSKSSLQASRRWWCLSQLTITRWFTDIFRQFLF